MYNDAVNPHPHQCIRKQSVRTLTNANIVTESAPSPVHKKALNPHPHQPKLFGKKAKSKAIRTLTGVDLDIFEDADGHSALSLLCEVSSESAPSPMLSQSVNPHPHQCIRKQ